MVHALLSCEENLFRLVIGCNNHMTRRMWLCSWRSRSITTIMTYFFIIQTAEQEVICTPAVSRVPGATETSTPYGCHLFSSSIIFIRLCSHRVLPSVAFSPSSRPLNPVSYTHLDVYKRQEFCLVFLPQFILCFTRKDFVFGSNEVFRHSFFCRYCLYYLLY